MFVMVVAMMVAVRLGQTARRLGVAVGHGLDHGAEKVRLGRQLAREEPGKAREHDRLPGHGVRPPAFGGGGGVDVGDEAGAGAIPTSVARRVAPALGFGGGFDVTRTDVNVSSLRDDDDVIEIPVGAGMAFQYGGFILDLRGDYAFAAEEDLLRVDTNGPGLDNWSATLRAGVEF